jgi:hypothetical protein
MHSCSYEEIRRMVEYLRARLENLQYGTVVKISTKKKSSNEKRDNT